MQIPTPGVRPRDRVGVAQGRHMDNKHRTAAMLAAAFVIAGSDVAAAPSAPAPAPASAPAPAMSDDALAHAYVGWVGRILEVPTTSDFDQPLRDAMATMVTEHLARLKTLVPAWIAEERARGGPALSDASVSRAIHNRLVNEMALWRLESPGADYDAVLTRAILRPTVCVTGARSSYMGLLMDWFQAVPAADRPTLLAGERTLLAHWGTHRTALAARPVPSLADDEAAEIMRLRSGEAKPDVAMPPFLADNVFKAEPETLATRCALHQWGLARALRGGAAPGAALLSWRYASLKPVDDWTDPATVAAGGAPADYPRVAQIWAVTGSVDVRVAADAQGRYASARVATRHVVVPGVTDNPPVAFETVFDAASLKAAPQRFIPLKAGADGVMPRAAVMRIDWKLQ